MDRHIKKIIDYVFDFKSTSEYLFYEKFGFTFVFRRDITTLNEKITSAEILPIGIIYVENGEYYYAPLHGTDEIDGIVKDFVKNI